MLFNTTYKYKNVCPESLVKSSRNQNICFLEKSNVDEHGVEDALEKSKKNLESVYEILDH
jgi:hypothetical protein